VRVIHIDINAYDLRSPALEALDLAAPRLQRPAFGVSRSIWISSDTDSELPGLEGRGRHR
jgi:hypothetical protein